MEKLLELYKEYSGTEPLSVEPITGSGSNRRYYRFTTPDGRSVIGVIGTSHDENHAFIYLTRHFTARHLPVPRVLAVGEDGLRYMQEDLGSRSLFDALKGGRDAGGRYDETEKSLLRQTIAALPALQIQGAVGLDFSHCYPQPEMDQTSVHFDLNYFKYCFLKATGIDFHELRLEADFKLFAKDLTADAQQAFLYRDFQARNVMLSADGSPHFIDYQGGRRGPVQYDLASFLLQASARYSQELREELIEVYLTNLKLYADVDEKRFRGRLKLFVLFRLLQVLGAYGFRGYFERKRHFLESIPPAMQNLRELLADAEACPYTYLREILGELTALPQFQPEKQSPQARSDGRHGPLRVRVFSFSYRKGIPADESGNGGGYVFDCRSTHNPGRYEPYKQLTGLDEPVVRFLEDDGEILTFLESVYRLADAHVERYMQRGFTDLMFAFGCTGGQHRSVYCAQHLAERLNAKYGIEVVLTHREQGIKTVLPAQ